MSSIRFQLSIALALTAGCALQPHLTQTTTDDGVKEGVVTLRDYSSARRDEALKLIASECPAGYDLIEEGPVRVTRPFFRTTIQATEYRIAFRERNYHSLPPLPTRQEAGLPDRPNGDFLGCVERELKKVDGDAKGGLTDGGLTESEINARLPDPSLLLHVPGLTPAWPTDLNPLAELRDPLAFR